MYNTFIDNVEDLDFLFECVYNLLGYSINCSISLWSLWSYYRDRVNNDANENNSANNYRQNNNKKTASKFFEYKTKMIGNTTADNNTLEIKFLVSLKYFNNFWRYPNLPLIYCEITLD